jgi:hypothetical protein
MTVPTLLQSSCRPPTLPSPLIFKTHPRHFDPHNYSASPTDPFVPTGPTLFAYSLRTLLTPLTTLNPTEPLLTTVIPLSPLTRKLLNLLTPESTDPTNPNHFSLRWLTAKRSHDRHTLDHMHTFVHISN